MPIDSIPIALHCKSDVALYLLGLIKSKPFELLQSFNNFFQHSVLSHVLKFEADTINALEGDSVCLGSKIGARSCIDRLIADFLLGLGQGV